MATVWHIWQVLHAVQGSSTAGSVVEGYCDTAAVAVAAPTAAFCNPIVVAMASPTQPRTGSSTIKMAITRVRILE